MTKDFSVNFLVIGFPRCGTTWLHSTLKKHPEIFLPEKKELKFFNKEYEKGFEYYRSWFAKAGSDQICGEITPNYIYSEDALKRVYSSFPNIKLIVVMRNPVHRLYSSYRFFYEQYNERSFQDLLKEESFLKSSQYIDYIKRWSELYPYKAFKFLVFEEMMSKPMLCLQEIFKFLDVDQGIEVKVDKSSSNLTVFPKAQSLLYKCHLSWIIEAIKNTFLNNIIRDITIKKSKSQYNALDKKNKKNLINYYRPYNQELQNFIKKDLFLWEKS
jgi:hypothetical protein